MLGGAVHADLAVLSWPRSAPRERGPSADGRENDPRNPFMMFAIQREGGGGGGSGSPHATGRGGRGHLSYSRNPPHAVLGEALVERRLLEITGWTVVPVGRHVWKVWEGQEEQMMFLLGCMDDAAARKVREAQRKGGGEPRRRGR